MQGGYQFLATISKLSLLILGINVLGVVENMADIKISLSSIGQAYSGLRFVSQNGDDITQETLAMYVHDFMYIKI